MSTTSYKVEVEKKKPNEFRSAVRIPKRFSHSLKNATVTSKEIDFELPDFNRMNIKPNEQILREYSTTKVKRNELTITPKKGNSSFVGLMPFFADLLPKENEFFTLKMVGDKVILSFLDNIQFVDECLNEESEEVKAGLIKDQSSILDNRTRDNRENRKERKSLRRKHQK